MAKVELEPATDWPEVMAFVFFLLAFLATLATNVVLNYVLSILAGLAFGRVLFRQRKNPRMTFLLGVIGLLGGLFVGGFGTNRKIIVVAFALAVVTSYYLHKKRFITSIEI